MNDEPADRVGFWLGNPADETKEIYYKHFGIQHISSDIPQGEHHEQTLTTKTGHADLELALALNSDMM